MGKGMRFSRVSRNWAAVEAVARVWAWMTSLRETTSRAVNCLKICPAGNAHQEYRLGRGLPAGKPRTAWVWGWRKGGRAGRDGPRRCGAAPSDGHGVSVGPRYGPPWKWKPESAAGAAEPRACPCPSEDSAGAGPGRDRPGGSTRWAGGAGAGGESALPR